MYNMIFINLNLNNLLFIVNLPLCNTSTNVGCYIRGQRKKGLFK